MHVGTNDLKSTKSPETIAENISILASSIKSKNNSVCVSAICPRNDSFNEKAGAVNKILRVVCKDNNLNFIEHKNIQIDQHINSDKLHLNRRGTSAIVKNFLNYMKNG